MSDNLSDQIEELKSSLEAERIRCVEAELRLVDNELEMRHKDDLLASMSHELRTPLTAVIGIAEGLQEEVYGPVNEQQCASLKSIEDGGRDLLNLVSDIVDLAKIETDRLQVEIGPVDVQFVSRSSLRFIKEMAQKKRVTVKPPENCPERLVLADQRCLKQILVNLLRTAVKYTPPEREMGLNVEEVTDPPCIRFTVWDSSEGEEEMDNADLMREFLTRGSREASELAGTGWSLSLVKQLVELHDGRIEIESRRGEGNRFTVDLPVAEDSAPE